MGVTLSYLIRGRVSAHDDDEYRDNGMSVQEGKMNMGVTMRLPMMPVLMVCVMNVAVFMF